jgi:AraC family transcriptional regulator
MPLAPTHAAVTPRVVPTPTTPQELVRWVPDTFELPSISDVQVHEYSGDRWGNVRICQKITRGPFVMPKGHVATDLVAIVLRAPVREVGCFGNDRVTNRGGRGTINVIPAGMPYTYSCEGEREILHISLQRDPDPSSDPLAPGALRPTFVASDPLIVNIGSALLKEATAYDPVNRIYGESLGTALRAHLARHYSERSRVSRRAEMSGLSRRQLDRVLDYVEAHLERPLGLDELARLAGRGRTQFITEFKRATGTTPHQYVVTRRIERAKLLLASEELPLHEVAARTGYAHQATFTRAFLVATRMTPGAYRRAQSA